MYRTIAFLVIALVAVFADRAVAGGKDCAEKDKAAAAAATADQKAAEIAARGWLGLETTKDEAGTVAVKAVEAESPAEAAGFRAGDVLVAMNGIALTAENKEALKKVKSGFAVGRQVTYTVRRGAETRQIAATLAPVPAEVLARWMAKEPAAAATVAAKGN